MTVDECVATYAIIWRNAPGSEIRRKAHRDLQYAVTRLNPDETREYYKAIDRFREAESVARLRRRFPDATGADHAAAVVPCDRPVGTVSSGEAIQIAPAPYLCEEWP